jgi:amidase
MARESLMPLSSAMYTLTLRGAARGGTLRAAMLEENRAEAAEARPEAVVPGTDAIARATALELASWVRERRVSAEDLAWHALDAIDRANPLVSAFVDVLRDTALREARAIDKKLRARTAARARREPLPPFYGVPLGVKDLNATRGSFTRFGSRAFERLFTPFDDATTARLRAAGFVLVGKTTTSELGALPVTEPDVHPPTRNPWDLGVTAGGSSGGAAAALASSMIPIAQGSDAGGSIRIPAAFCGVFGLKPSRGRVENSYGLEDGSILYTCGPLTHTVDDAAALLDVMAGLTVGKPHWAPAPPSTFLELARRGTRRLKVRYLTTHALAPVHPEIAAAVERVAALARELGHDVREGESIQGSIEDFVPVWQRLVADAPVHDWALTQPVTRWLGEAGRRVKREDVERQLAKTSREMLAWFGDADLWLTPTVAQPPPRVGAWRGLGPRETFFEAAKLGVFTAPFNVSGQPAASVPAGRTRDGHPIGVQVAGRPLGDAAVLAFCRELEGAMPWPRPHLPLFGEA